MGGTELGKTPDRQALFRFSIPTLGEVLSERIPSNVGGACSGLLFG